MSTGKAIGGSVLGLVFFVVAEIVSSLIGEGLYSLGLNAAACNAVAGILFVAFSILLFKALTKILKIRMEDVGITKVRFSLKWVFIAILLPVAVLGVFLLLPGDFVLSDMSKTEMASRLSAGIFFSGIGSGFVEEMLFRGFIMRLLKKRWNTAVAVIIPSFLFGLIHIIGMEFSVTSCLLVIAAGTFVGIMLSLISLEGNNIWNSGIVHCFWNIIIIGGALFVGSEADTTNSIVSYVLENKSFALTGGEFGIESSIVAVAGYVLISALALVFLRTKSPQEA
ncbi:MAG: CPBP family intramembrane metalloprotease [Clostridiales bacterium]|nr:CPBP family intramembrane metalloprotease [Clostridiales bacterium]